MSIRPQVTDSVRLANRDFKLEMAGEIVDRQMIARYRCVGVAVRAPQAEVPIACRYLLFCRP
jgi:hypothetical protein